jgi:cyanophycin synthetase
VGAIANSSTHRPNTAVPPQKVTSVQLIRSGISTLHPSVTQIPGRVNLIDFVAFKVLVDYGHNVPAVTALGTVLPHIGTGRKIVVAHGTGNRTDDNIKAFGAALASVYNHLILADVDPRARAPGETPDLVRAGALETGFPETSVEIVTAPLKAIDRAFTLVQPGDLLVIQVDEVDPMLGRVMEHFEQIVAKA